MDYAPPTLEVLGICLLWMLKAAGLAMGIVLFVAWNLMRITLTIFFFGRLPRSYVRIID